LKSKESDKSKKEESLSWEGS